VSGSELRPGISPESFFAADIRAGRITTVVAFPEAQRPAWKIEVDFGAPVGRLWTSAQVTNYTQEELIGRMTAGVINLGPKQVAGFTSEFLLLGAVEPDGVVRLLELPDSTSLGARIA